MLADLPQISTKENIKGMFGMYDNKWQFKRTIMMTTLYLQYLFNHKYKKSKKINSCQWTHLLGKFFEIKKKNRPNEIKTSSVIIYICISNYNYFM